MDNLSNLMEWISSKPELLASLTQRMTQETEPKLEVADPPHYRKIEYFWFDGFLYRREGFEARPDSLWESYKESLLSGKTPWWSWTAVSGDLSKKLEQLYRSRFR